MWIARAVGTAYARGSNENPVAFRSAGPAVPPVITGGRMRLIAAVYRDGFLSPANVRPPKGCQLYTRPTTSVELWPPNPNELDAATLISFSTCSVGSRTGGQSGSSVSMLRFPGTIPLRSA